MPERRVLVVAGVLLVTGTGACGYLIGAGSAPNAADARTEKAQAYLPAFRSAAAGARRSSRAQGQRRGLAAGRARGRRQGASIGSDRGQAAASDEAARIAAQQQAATAAAVPSQGNCHVPLFVQGYCPTPSQIAQENAAEAAGGY